jgi:hypothetical protein
MKRLSQHWFAIQDPLFPHLREEIGVMGDNHERLVRTIELSGVVAFMRRMYPRLTGGRPSEWRENFAIGFLAKSIFNLPTTRALIDRLMCDPILRRLCGWERRSDIPSESTFSRVFYELAERNVIPQLHDLFIVAHHGDRIIGHVKRDATEIDAREKAAPTPKKTKMPPKKKGRPKKGEERCLGTKDLTRLERQCTQSLREMIAELPTACNVGSKVNSQGYKTSWTGYKLHIDTIDGDIPVSAILTSASLHDSQVALPLSVMTEKKVRFLYELMDAAYDAVLIRQSIAQKGRVPLIDFNRRSPKDTRRFENFEQVRYKERSGSERVNSHLKDNLGARFIRVRGHQKVFAHLSFGLIIMAIEQTLRLLT